MSALGTELKINVHVEPINGISMSDYDFECAFYVYTNKKVIINKSDMKMVDNNNYIAIIESIDAMKLGRGKINLEFTGYIPDSDFKDGFRTEKAVVCTDAVIV